ncbi:MAG TPA: polysaccharide deacetylase family protein, partial [Longimicrobiales bacterium]|nr:polysaccharide deacetylase family protein [Longimicrobiales bacterium]
MIHLLLAFQLQRTVAVTIDDLPIISEVRTAANDDYITRNLLKTLQADKIPAIGFVNEGKMFGHPNRTEILKRWLDARMDLGNHSYSHHDLNTTPLDEFQRDVLNGERITSRLLKERGRKIRYFRHPFLHSGADLKKKRAFESWLHAHGYEVAPVTIDNMDFIYARAYERAKLSGKLERASEIGRQYVAYMDRIFAFYEDQSRKILKREPAQTLLLHASLLNADYMDELVAMMK